jgi:hypothetical protein
MPAEPLSEHCSLMQRPGGPAKPTARPADCLDDAAYIKTTPGGSRLVIPGDSPYPIVFEGGEGDDKVVVVGDGGRPVLVGGGKGNDALTVQTELDWLVGTLGPGGLALLGSAALICALLALIAWRALGPGRHRPG